MRQTISILWNPLLVWYVSWSTALLNKLIITQRVNKFLRFIWMLTMVRHLSLLSTRWTMSTPFHEIYFKSILILSRVGWYAWWKLRYLTTTAPSLRIFVPNSLSVHHRLSVLPRLSLSNRYNIIPLSTLKSSKWHLPFKSFGRNSIWIFFQKCLLHILPSHSAWYLTLSQSNVLGTHC